MNFLKISRRAAIFTAAAFALLLGFLFSTRLQFNLVESAPKKQSSKVTPTTLVEPALVQRYQQMITPEMLASRLHFLASDLFEGRETTTRGQKLAAEYLASQYRQLGLEPKGNMKQAGTFSPRAYLQSFPVYRRTPKETHLEISINGNRLASSSFSAVTHDDLSYFLSGDLRNSSGGVVFAGYGIADDALGYNDYAALAAKAISIDGKWLLILDDEPLVDANTSLLPTSQHKLSKWSQIFSKRRAVLTAGKPLGLLVVTSASPRNKGTFAEAAALASGNARRLGALSINQHSDAPTAYAISTKLANQLLAPSSLRF
ncbi:MAG TPA: hypothetical protein VGO73_04675 [Pyrinomonadaceae bacterium]|jgi:hypothetical protein|nr:hypothetical protein [Pyrinomonadaceae bacterium]